VTTAWIERLAILRERYRVNFASIIERGRRVQARSRPRLAALTRGEILILAVAAAALVLATGFAFDAVSVERARSVPFLIDAVFGFISEMGKSQWELWPAGIAMLILWAGRWDVVPRFVRAFWAEFGALTAYLFLSIAGAGILVNIIKQFIGRSRPVTFDYFGPFILEPFRFMFEFQSFPSGHSATGGALIAFGMLAAKRWKVALLLFGLLIGASRVVVGAHYPSDVVAGLLFGYVFSLWLAHLFARYGWAFSFTSTGLIRARSDCIRLGFSSPGRTTHILAGLADALVGRPVWLLELKPVGNWVNSRDMVRQRERAEHDG